MESWLELGISPRRPSSENLSAKALGQWVRFKKSSFERKAPFLAPSSIPSATASPSPAIQLKLGMIFPSPVIWKSFALAR